jgi:gamma-glutamyltranspeptidase/glutathione hydrolase
MNDQSWALACPGGDVIVQAMAQVVWRVLKDTPHLQEAVELPRIAAFNAPSAFHPHPSADRLVYVEKRLGEDEIKKLSNHGHNVEVWPEFEFDAGSVQTIQSQVNSNGTRFMMTGTDPRRSAYAQAE